MWDASNGFALKGHYRTGHSRNVFCVKYVPNQDNSFVSCGMDGDVRLTDLIAVRRACFACGMCVRSCGVCTCRALQQEDHRVVPRVELLSRSPDDMTVRRLVWSAGGPGSRGRARSSRLSFCPTRRAIFW